MPGIIKPPPKKAIRQTAVIIISLRRWGKKKSRERGTNPTKMRAKGRASLDPRKIPATQAPLKYISANGLP